MVILDASDTIKKRSFFAYRGEKRFLPVPEYLNAEKLPR
jgi:hypothetical protein